MPCPAHRVPGIVILALCSVPLCGQTGELRRSKDDTERLAAHLKRFRGREKSARPVDGLTGGELAATRDECLRWLDTRLLAGAGEREMNGELSRSGVIRRQPRGTSTEVLPDYQGWLDEVVVRTLPGAADLMEVRVGIGTVCGFDESIAVYRRDPLVRLGIISQAVRADEIPVPWWYSAMAVGPKNRDGLRLMAVAGNSGWCTSNIRAGTLRVDEIQGSTLHTVLNQDVGYWSGNDVYPAARFQGNTAEFIYEVLIPGPDVLSRKAIVRYALTSSGLQRVAPIALSRTGFIHKWLTMQDSAAARWSTREAAHYHPQLTGWAGDGFSFEGVAVCAGNPKVWQVQVRFQKPAERRTFALSGERAYDLRLLDVTRQPGANCQQSTSKELEQDLQAPR